MSKSYTSQSPEHTSEQNFGSYRSNTGVSNQLMMDRLNNSLSSENQEGSAPDLHCENDHEHPSPELGSIRAGAPTTKRAALSRHKQNQDKVKRIIHSGLAQQVDPNAGVNSRVNLLRNTCQWIEAGEANLFVLTPTHDSQVRPTCPADKIAYFDTRTQYNQDGGTYDDTLNASGQAVNDNGLEFKFSGVAGSMGLDGVTMTLVDPVSHTEGEIVTFFIHEVQHDADQHRDGAWTVSQPPRAASATTRAPKWAYNQYQSEFRAYWMMNPEGSSADWFDPSSNTSVTNFSIIAIHKGQDRTLGTADDVTSTVSTAFTNKRQQDIFNHMHGGGRTDNIYLDASGNWTKSYAYLAHYYALDPAFKAMVDRYTTPVSGNLINSPRIQDLSDALPTGNFFVELYALDDMDIRYLRDRTASRPFWTQVNQEVGLVQQIALETYIDNNASTMGPYQETVTVVTGDTLGSIAERYLNDSARWRELYALNRRLIGDNPDYIRAGQLLQMPAL